jgi:hypothetical protein
MSVSLRSVTRSSARSRERGLEAVAGAGEVAEVIGEDGREVVVGVEQRVGRARHAHDVAVGLGGVAPLLVAVVEVGQQHEHRHVLRAVAQDPAQHADAAGDVAELVGVELGDAQPERARALGGAGRLGGERQLLDQRGCRGRASSRIL